MATNKVAMGMVVLKWMKEGIISTVGPGRLKVGYLLCNKINLEDVHRIYGSLTFVNN